MGVNNGVPECQHATNSPSFPAGFGPVPNLDKVAACVLDHCKVCSTDINVCTMCKKDEGWYLGRTADNFANECQHATTSPTFPDGFGPNLVNFKVEMCDLANCKECLADKSACTRCKDGQGWYLGRNSGNTADECQHATTTPVFPAGFGPNLTNKKVENCKLDHCKTCSSTIDTCTACKTAKGWYLGSNPVSTAPECQHASNSPMFPAGKGPATDGSVANCIPTSCDKCSTAVETCQVCITSYFLKEDENKCLDEPNFPSGMGGDPNNSPPNIKTCLVASCDKCGLDITKCIQCNGGLFADQTTPACLDQTELDGKSAYGKVTTNSFNQVKACSTPNCGFCTDDFSVCTACKPTYYFLASKKLCYDDANIELGYGKILISGSTPTEIAKCTIDQCKACNQDNSDCTVCNDGFYWQSEDKLCSSVIAPGYGLVSGTTVREIKKCTASQNCLTCDDDNTKCMTCQSNWVLEVASSKCYDGNMIPAGFGRDLATTTGQEDIRACQDATNCKLCEADYMKCTECNAGIYLFSTDSKCYNYPTFPSSTGIVTPPAGSTEKKIDSCKVTGCALCIDDYSICTKCNPSFYFDNTNNICYSKIPAKYGLIAGTIISEIATCTETLCQKCEVDNTLCEQCISPNYLDGTTCSTTIPLGKGKDLSAPVDTIKTCTDPRTVTTATMTTLGAWSARTT